MYHLPKTGGRFIETKEKKNFIHSTFISDINVYKKETMPNDTGLLTQADSSLPLIDLKLHQFLDSVNKVVIPIQVSNLCFLLF